MKADYTIRAATMEDVDFLSETILAAEMSGTDRAGLATLFDLTTDQAKDLVVRMLEEEIDGCELSVSSFLVACADDQPVAAVGGWVEGRMEDMPSSLLKSNLIGFTFPKESMQALAERRGAVRGIQIERERDALQIEYVYVRPEHRGNDLAGRLVRAHFAQASDQPGVHKAQVQVFADNASAIRSYERLGFTTARSYRSKDPDTLRFLPWNEKLLMERTLN